MLQLLSTRTEQGQLASGMLAKALRRLFGALFRAPRPRGSAVMAAQTGIHLLAHNNPG